LKNLFSYPFYKSLRFRFGLIFGFLFLVCLLAIAFFLYKDVQQQLEKSFSSRLNAQAKIILQKTEISPLIVPLPDEKEYFLLTYNNTQKTDTLFNNLPIALKRLSFETQYWRSVQSSRTLETGGVITIVYALRADELNNALEQLRAILFIYIPVVLIASFIAAYFLSGFLLKPITNIISKANHINLQNNIQLIDEPATKDELHNLVFTLNKMLERIQKQSQQQNAFFASASHELRTPLSNMLTELQVLQSQNISPQMQDVFKSQVAEVQRLKKLVNDFLLMSQLKAGAVYVNKTDVDVADVCLNCIEKLKKKSKEKHQTFKIELEPEHAEFIVKADKGHLFIVLNNLLDNAVKYGIASSLISVSIVKTNDSIFIKIINETDAIINNVESLTKEFTRNDVLKEGFGLGLWITAQLVNINKGELTLSFDNPLFQAEVIV